jgi:hypothetical protein
MACPLKKTGHLLFSDLLEFRNLLTTAFKCKGTARMKRAAQRKLCKGRRTSWGAFSQTLIPDAGKRTDKILGIRM